MTPPETASGNWERELRTVAQVTIEELERELATLAGLRERARALLDSGLESKFERLREVVEAPTHAGEKWRSRASGCIPASRSSTRCRGGSARAGAAGRPPRLARLRPACDSVRRRHPQRRGQGPGAAASRWRTTSGSRLHLGGRYRLYVVLDCATPVPTLVRVQDPFSKLLAASRASFAHAISTASLLEAAERD